MFKEIVFKNKGVGNGGTIRLMFKEIVLKTREWGMVDHKAIV